MILESRQEGNQMNNLEFASFMGMKGYSVHKKSGFDVEALLFHDDVDSRPINYKSLEVAAKQEGYVLIDSFGWVKENSLCFIN